MGRFNQGKFLPTLCLCKHHQNIDSAAYSRIWTKSWLHSLDLTSEAWRFLEIFPSALFTSLTLCTVSFYFTLLYLETGLTFCSAPYLESNGNQWRTYSQILDFTTVQKVPQSIAGWDQVFLKPLLSHHHQESYGELQLIDRRALNSPEVILKFWSSQVPRNQAAHLFEHQDEVLTGDRTTLSWGRRKRTDSFIFCLGHWEWAGSWRSRTRMGSGSPCFPALWEQAMYRNMSIHTRWFSGFEVGNWVSLP